MSHISNLSLNVSTITRDIRRCECILFGEEPSFSEKLNLPKKILEPNIRVPEFMGADGLIQINIEDGFLGTIRRVKVRMYSDTPNAQICLSNIDSKEIQLVPCYRAIDPNIQPDAGNNTVDTVGVSYIPVINELITILSIRCILINNWRITRGWNNVQWIGELTKSAFYGINCPVNYDILRPTDGLKKCGIFLGNLKMYEVQMNKNDKIVGIDRLLPYELMGLANDEDNIMRLMEAYLHLAAKVINCLTFSERIDFLPS